MKSIMSDSLHHFLIMLLDQCLTGINKNKVETHPWITNKILKYEPSIGEIMH